MVDIQSATAEIRRGKSKKERRRKKKPQGKNIMACPIAKVGHKSEFNVPVAKTPTFFAAILRPFGPGRQNFNM